MNLHVPGQGGTVEVGPESAGWEYSGLRVVILAPGVAQTVATGDREMFILPLAGGLTVEVSDLDGVEAERFVLTGRTSVFTAVSDFAYVGRDSLITLRSDRGAEVALPFARCTRRRAARYAAAADVPIEVRGAGRATRQITNFGTPDAWEHAEKLICCELITPPGNWSSYPPHKHDATDPCAVTNEEIYYYRIAGDDQITPSSTGFGIHRMYTGPEHAAAGLAELDETITVRDGDVVLVPHGYHGPSVAAPDYAMYYLNILAGPGDARSMAFCDDPAHAWIRNSWKDQAPDPRCPVTSAAGRVGVGNG